MRHVRINGRWGITMPDHRYVRYLEEGDWEKERIASMWLNIDKTDVILDVGAEEGDMSGLFASWVPEGGIMLMEPNPRVWPNIRAVWEGNALPDPLSWWVGFASSTNETPMSADVLDPYGDVGWPECAYGPVIGDHGFRHLAEEADTTPQITINAFVAHGEVAPTVITMDVEGAELEALKGAEGLLMERRPLVWVSVHPEFMRHHFDQRPRDLLAFMETLDYRCTHLGDDHESHWFMEPR